MMACVYFAREYRETRKLSTEDRLARREGYAKQVEGLLVENRRLRTDLAEFEQRHTEYRRYCEDEHDAHRKMIRDLADEVTGLKRALAAGQVAAFETLPPNLIRPTVAAAAERTRDIIAERDGKR